MEKLVDKERLTEDDYNEILSSVKIPTSKTVQVKKSDGTTESVNVEFKVDKVLFKDVLELMAKNMSGSIYLPEDDPEVKIYLAQKEQQTVDALAAVQLKMSPAERVRNDYLSRSEKYITKYFTKDEKIQHKIKVAEELKNAVYRAIGYYDVPISTPPRRLTEKEIDDILREIDFSKVFTDKNRVNINPKVAVAAANKVKFNLRNQLTRTEISPDYINDLTNTIKQRFMRSVALPGKMVGNIMSGVMGENSTQQTLNTFHSAGNKDSRKTITGFAKQDSILKAAINPPVVAQTIFMLNNYNREQLHRRSHRFLFSTLSSLIIGHTIIKSSTPKPRWERIWDSLMGIDERVMTYGREAIHRGNPIFSTIKPYIQPPEVVGRILQIQLDPAILFARKITMTDVITAIENSNSDLRVTASTIDVGLINVYYRFQGVSAFIDAKGEEIPAYVKEDEFKYSLEYGIYPMIKEIHIKGVPGVDFVSIESNYLNESILFPLSELETISPESQNQNQMNTSINNVMKRTVKLAINPERTVLWAITRQLWENLVRTRLRLYYNPGYNFNFQFDQINNVLSFDVTNLQFYKYVDINEEKDKKRQKEIAKKKLKAPEPKYIVERKDITFEDVKKLLNEKDPKIRAADLITDIKIETNPNSPPVLTFKLKRDIIIDLVFDVYDTISEIDEFFNKSIGNNVYREPEKRIEFVKDPNDKYSYTVNKLHLHANDIKDFFFDHITRLEMSSEYFVDSGIKWYYSTSGRNLKKVLIMDGVDPYHTRSDDTVEMFTTFGDEVYRAVVIEELMSATDGKINYVHIELLADSLRYRTIGNKPTARTLEGMSKINSGLISTMFQQTSKAAFLGGLGEVDNLNGFSAEIMMGNLRRRKLLEDEEMNELMKTNPAFSVDFPEYFTDDGVTMQEEIDEQPELEAADEFYSINSISTDAGEILRPGQRSTSGATIKPSANQNFAESLNSIVSSLPVTTAAISSVSESTTFDFIRKTSSRQRK